MGDFTPREIADIVFVYGFCNGNALAAVREYHYRFPNRRIPNHQVFTTTFRRLGETGLSRAPGVGRKQRENAAQIEEAVIDEVLDNPSVSTRRISMQLELSQNFVWRTIHREQLHPYHYTTVQALHPGDAEQRVTFCQWLLGRLHNDPNLISFILWTDEAIFTRDGLTNFRNLHHYSIDNPHLTRRRRFQHRFSVNLWGGIFNGSLLELKELDNRLNANGYRNFLHENIPDVLDPIPLNIRRQMFFQHDGAPPHSGRIVTDWLNEHFNGRWIGRFGPVRWPPRSPDLNPLDFFLWGFLKQLVYREEIHTREQLQHRILEGATHIRENFNIQQVYESLIRRCRACIDVGGGNFEQLL